MSTYVSCPHCGTTLEVGRNKSTVRCDYCKAEVQILDRSSDKLSGVAAGQIMPEQPGSIKGRVSCILLTALLVFIGMGFVSAVMVLGLFDQETETVEEDSLAELPEEVPADDDAGFASVVMSFDSEGIGPGQFEDARVVAVDSQGNIYVGEYSNGRTQVFDSAGMFLTAWLLEGDVYLKDLAVDRSGTAYLVYGGEIHRYDAATGQLNGIVEYDDADSFVPPRFEAIAIMLDGSLLAVQEIHMPVENGGGVGVVQFDPQGHVINVVSGLADNQSDDFLSVEGVAVDGLGNIYLLAGSFDPVVLKFSPDGAFLDRFGSGGDEPGQFRSVNDIVVDGQGRIYVSGSGEIEVFNGDGLYLDTIDVDGPAFGLTISESGDLFVAARDKVIQYDLPE